MTHVFRQHFSIRKAFFILGEGVLIYCAVFMAAFFFLKERTGMTDLIEIVSVKTLLVAVITQVSLYFKDLYEFKASDNIVDLATRLIQAIGITCIALSAIYFIWPGAIIGRWIFFFSIILLLLFLVSWRLLYALVIKNRLFTDNIIIVGSGMLASDIIKEIKDRRDISYDVKLIFDDEKRRNSSIRLEDFQVQYGFNGLCEKAADESVSDIIVALDERRGHFPHKELLNCKMRGISIVDGESFYEKITGKILVERINPSWLIFSDGFVKSRISRRIKRSAGLFLSSLMLIISFPFLFLVAVAIKLESRGPVLFSQERVGENEELFRIYKFRSMKAGAEEETGPVWATHNDARITRIGKFIRRFRIDELPQLWNVLKGDMSFVGPRPERLFFVNKLVKNIPYYKERFTVKPGITGWAQIKYEYAASEKDALEKLKYDLYYIKNMSFIMDLIIIFQSIKIVLLRRGAR